MSNNYAAKKPQYNVYYINSKEPSQSNNLTARNHSAQSESDQKKNGTLYKT